MDEFERTVNELESLFIDPHMKQVIDKVVAMNDALEKESVSDDEARMLMGELNDSWSNDGYMMQKMHITGDMYVGGMRNAVEHRIESPGSLMHVKEQVVKSRGFMFNATPILDGEEVHIKQEVMLRGLTRIKEDGGKKGSYIECAIPLHPDTVIERRDMTPAKAAAWLHIYHPAMKELVDASIDLANNEVQSIMQLKEAPLPLGTNRKKEIQQLQDILEKYLQSKLSYESFVPYSATIEGSIERYDATAAVWVQKELPLQQKQLMNILSTEVSTNKENAMLQIGVTARMISANKHDAYIARFPLSAIQDLRSMRDM